MYIKNYSELLNLKDHFASVPIGFGKHNGKFLFEIEDEYFNFLCKYNEKKFCRFLDLKDISLSLRNMTVQKFREGMGRRQRNNLDTENLNKTQIKFLEEFGRRQFGGRIGRIGAGKTRTVLSIIKNFGGKSLIVCSKNLFTSWQEEMNKYGIEQKPVIINGTCGEKLLSLNNKAEIYLINYHSFLVDEIVSEIIKAGFDNIFLDESQTIKNPKAQITATILKASWTIPFRYFITGTPRTNKMFDVWSQCAFLDHGKSLYNNFYEFRKIYFTQKNYEWYLSEHNKNIISERMSKICMTDEAVERVGKPIHKQIDNFLNDEEIKIYKKALTELLLLRKDETIPITNQLSLALRLSQICGGGVNEERIKNATKINTLKEVIEEINEPVIIICNFTDEIKEIKKTFPAALVYYGGVSIEEKDAARKKFINKESDILIMQQRMAVGVNGLQDVCRVMIFYSQSYAWDLREQNQGRIDREGQKDDCIFIDIISRIEGMKTADENIKDAVSKKDIDIKDFIRRLAGNG